MVNSNLDVFISLAQSIWLVFLLDIVGLETLVGFFLLFFDHFKFINLFNMLYLVFILILDFFLVFCHIFLHPSNKALESLNLRDKSLLFILNFHREMTLDFILSHLKAVEFGLKVVFHFVDVVNLFLDLDNLIVKLL